MSASNGTYGVARDDIDVMALETDVPPYSMTSTSRGLAVIWCCSEFEDKSDNLLGYKVDAENLEKVLKALSFTVVLKENVKYANKDDLLREHAYMANYDKFDAFVFCVMSHGNKNGFRTFENRKFVEPEYVASFFDNADGEHPNLMKKPKMFFIQACRGGKNDHGFPQQTKTKFEHYVYKDALKADFLTVFSSPPDYKSYVLPDQGSYFVRALVDVLSRYTKPKEYEVSLTDALLETTRMVAEGVEITYEIPGKPVMSIKQVPWMSSTLTRRVLFPPLLTTNQGDALGGAAGAVGGGKGMPTIGHTCSIPDVPTAASDADESGAHEAGSDEFAVEVVASGVEDLALDQ